MASSVGTLTVKLDGVDEAVRKLNEARGIVADHERRTLLVEVRLAAPDSRRLVGHAAIFNEIADIGGQFREVIAPGAFRKALKGADVVARWNHTPDTILGRTASKTLRLSEDERGLAFELDLPNTTLGNDLLALVARGDVRGMSFAFAGARDKWDAAANLRTITDVGLLLDVSPVIEPAYAGTDLALRSRGEHLAAEQRERVSRLRNRLALYLAQQKEESL
jgi:HK97 family phage prohead protease